jgi:hypothetical protein
MGPAATTALGILTGLIAFLAMALLGVIAANGAGDAGIAPARAESAAAGGSGDTADANGDGFLSLAEAAGSEYIVSRFQRADRNKDGKLSKAEYNRLDKLPERKAKKARSVKESVRRDAAAASRGG